MSTHKYFDRICAVAVIIALLVTVVMMNGTAMGMQSATRTMGYEERLFDTGKVHTIDIVMNDWDDFIDNCQNEEYAVCSVVIDGEAFKNVGIRGKGNTSLSTVSSMNSDRYSFKIEFDQYDNTKSYYGLDKLSLNNLIQDSTMMKDYLTYQMMNEFGADAPLCSYVYITVNGEDWGLYLAVEGVEDAFLQRNYGNDYGELYKPDSLSFGGGRGNGMDFDMDRFWDEESGEFDFSQIPGMSENGGQPFGGESFGGQPFGGQSSGGGKRPEGGKNFGGMDFGNMDFGNMPGGMGFGGMGSSDVKLQYIDDNPNSYSNIFNNAKTDITLADQNRLIKALKKLTQGEDIEDVVNVDEVIRYFVVHNFVCNGDSYTGSMIHNYYLYEEEGRLSMIPWDYNLAFGTFQSSDATNTVNTPIDTPVSGGIGEDRPMISWIFENATYTDLYHQYFAAFLESVDIVGMIESAVELISPYVEKDPTKFYTVDEFITGVTTMKEFCVLRSESVSGQLEGTVPSTSQGQSADGISLVDASHLEISDMGSMGMGGKGGMGQGSWPEGFPGGSGDGSWPGNMPGGSGQGSWTPGR